MHGRLAHPGRLRRPVRRPRHGAPPRRRRGDPGQDEHGRVRDGLVDRALGLRADGEPVGPRPRSRAAAPAAPRRRWPPSTFRSRSAPTPAARSASRPPCAGSSASSRRTAGSAATGSSPSPARSTRSARSGATPATPPCSCTPSPAATSATRPPPRSPSPASCSPAGLRRRGGRVRCAASGWACPASTSSPAWSRASRPASARRSPRCEAAGAEIVDVSLPAHRLRPGGLLHRGARRGVGEPRPLRRHPVRPLASAAATSSANYLASRGARLRGRGEAPDHARHVRALGRLLRRLLRQGAEGPDAHQAGLRRRLRAAGSTPSSRRPARSWPGPSAPGWPTPSRCTSPTSARCR